MTVPSPRRSTRQCWEYRQAVNVTLYASVAIAVAYVLSTIHEKCKGASPDDKVVAIKQAKAALEVDTLQVDAVDVNR